MSINRDPFYDDGEVGTGEQSQENQPPPIPRKRLSTEIKPIEIIHDPTEIKPIAIIHDPTEIKPIEIIHDPTVTPRSLAPSPSPPLMQPVICPPETIKEEIHESKSSSSRSSNSGSFEPESDEEDKRQIQIQKPQEIEKEKNNNNNNKALTRLTADIDVQTDRVILRDESIQTETINIVSLSKPVTRIVSIKFESKRLHMPLVKTLFDQSISSALPIISFCQPFSMTSHVNDIILAMPRHLMIINNQNSVSVYPWQQPQESTSTILECFWCSFLYKLLVTTLEDNRLFIYDFISVIDTIKLRGHPLSIKQQTQQLKQTDSSLLLPPSARYQSLPAVWSQTRFTKSNSLGIYYCYISDRHYSTMLTRIDHNTRQHVKAIDCSGGSIHNNARICAMGLSDERVAVVLTNLIMTLYDAETLIGLKQINLSRLNYCNIRGVSALFYLWKTWLIFDPIENKVVGIGKRKRQFSKILPDQPINACSMDNGTLALWLGFPGALLYYRLLE